MTSRPRTTLLCLAAFVLVAVPPVSSETSASDDLHRIDATWNTLRLTPDVPALERLLTDDWILTHSDGRVQTKRDYLDELKTQARRNSSIANEDVKVRTYGDTAIVTGVSVQSGTSNGQTFGGRFRFTRVWVRVQGTWRMAASHSSRVEAPR